MLFSDENVAREINEKFEPIWVSVRDVPTVTIDFGKGHKIMRTLHGNVATHVLTADGTIVDILPGLYESQEYLAQLDQLWWVHHYMALNSRSKGFFGGLSRQANEFDRNLRQADGSETLRGYVEDGC